MQRFISLHLLILIYINYSGIGGRKLKVGWRVSQFLIRNS